MNEDEAVSAVIGVILMVAITVAIAATVYVYVSGMIGTGQDSTPNIAFAKSSDRITVSRSDAGLEWSEFQLTFSSSELTNVTLSGEALVYPATGTSIASAAGTVYAGHFINVTTATGGGTLSLRHTPTNSLIGTWTFT
ncbi:MAG: type IV pilin N-terminal domain-containing protein [Candidatus Thermoplasmatota archaeon]|nr:type IV pilin N-terminal domain-containing protein [Candidatus Thermoplasmatota archaeon]